MLIEAHTREKPAVPRRALFTSVFLLLLATALAGAMILHRSGESLMPRIEPRGWSISFRPPRRFDTVQFLPTPMGTTFLFQGRTQTDERAILGVHRLLGPAASDPEGACDRVLRAYRGRVPVALGITRLLWFDKKLGPYDAAEVWDRQLGVVVRAMVVGNEDAYAVSLHLQNTPIDPATYHLFDLTCDSIEQRTR